MKTGNALKLPPSMCPDSERPCLGVRLISLSGTPVRPQRKRVATVKRKLASSPASQTKRKGIRERPERCQNQHRPSNGCQVTHTNYK